MKVKNPIEKKRHLAKLRAVRVRARINGTAELPRLSVKRSSKHLYAQLIDDTVGKTLAAASDFEVVASAGKKITKTEAATEIGKLIASRAKEKGIELVVFDRGGYRYHGLVAALADGAREGGLIF